MRADLPAEVERGEQVGELLAVEDFAQEDGVDEAVQRVDRQAVRPGDVGELRGGFLSLKPGSRLDGLLVESPSPALRPRTYSVISSRSSMNLESAAIRPISSSRVIDDLPGVFAEKSAISFMM